MIKMQSLKEFLGTKEIEGILKTLIYLVYEYKLN
jgi:hypothetical protein